MPPVRTHGQSRNPEEPIDPADTVPHDLTRSQEAGGWIARKDGDRAVQKPSYIEVSAIRAESERADSSKPVDSADSVLEDLQERKGACGGIPTQD
jgi:hypothetical protein